MYRAACWGLLSVCLLSAPVWSAEPDPRRPASMGVENVPVVPAELARSLRRYQSIRHARFRGWLPDGQGMLIQTQFANTAQLHRVRLPGGDRTQVTFEDEPVDGRALPNSTEAFLSLMSVGGNENDQIYLNRIAGGAPQRLTDGKSRHLLGPVSRDGRWVVATSNRRNTRDMDLILGDLQEPGHWVDLLRVEKETWDPLAFSPDGKQLLLMKVVSINERYPAVLDVASKKLTLIPFPPGMTGKVAIGSGEFAADGQSVYLTSDANSEYLQLARIKLSDFSWTWLTTEIAHDIEHLTVDDRTGRVAFTANEGGLSGLYVLEGDQPKRLAVPTGIIDSLEFSPAGDQLGFTFFNTGAPADAYSLHLSTGKLTQWTSSETAGLNPQEFVKPELIEFPTFDKRQIPAWIFKPQRSMVGEKLPVLIIIHGGPESQYRPFFQGSDQFYVKELGLAVICPNVRGSAGYGKTYLQLDNAEKREDSVRDIGGLLDWIQTQPDLDASRVAVMGGSYGGYMVLGSLVMHGERLRAGVDIVGISNFLTFLENTSEYRRDLRRVEYGDERDPQMRAVFEKISPAKNAQRIKSALLVAHGKNDPRVPFSEARQIAPLVRKNGQDVWTVYADNEGHGFRKKDNRDYFTAIVALFLQQHLQTRQAPVTYREHQDLMYFLDAQGRRQAIDAPTDWEQRRRHILRNIEEVTGPLPGPEFRVPLDMKVVQQSVVGKLTRKKIIYRTDRDDRVSAWLFIPEHPAEKKLSAVLCLQQTTTLGKDEPAGLGGDPNLHYALRLAERGYVTLAPDYPSFGEHRYDFAPEHGYLSGTMKAVWDNIRAVDLLTTLPEVDASRIGVIGHSLGGHNALFTAAFEPRLKVIVSSCGFSRFHKDDVPSWTGPRYMPRIATVFENSADKLPFDFTEIVASLAPRPFLTCSAVGDDDFDVSGVKDVMTAVQPVYKLFGKSDDLQACYPEGGHGFHPEAQQAAWKFLDQHLQSRR